MSDGRIRVAFCVDNLHVGGTELNAVRQAERLDRARFDLRLVCLQPDGPLADRYRAAGIPIDVFTPGPLVGANAVRQGLRLRRYLRHHRIQVFHAHDLYSNLFGVPWARLAATKVIASRRWLGAKWAGRGGTTAARLTYGLAHVAVANSPWVAEYLARVDRVPRRRIAVVPNFVDERSFWPLSSDERRALRRELGLREEDAVVGVVAMLRPVKDHATLIRATALVAPRWPRLRVVLVGEGPSRPELERLAASLGVTGHVIFAGARANDPNVNDLFDISVLCSTREGLPNAILEAMAAGRPVVATDVGAVGDAVVEGETGLLVPASSPERLALALEQLLADPVRARRLGEAGRRRARDHYSPEVALSTLERLYVGLVRENAVPDGRAENGYLAGQLSASRSADPPRSA